MRVCGGVGGGEEGRQAVGEDHDAINDLVGGRWLMRCLKTV